MVDIDPVQLVRGRRGEHLFVLLPELEGAGIQDVDRSHRQ
jgi:hypothetical protein